LLGLKKLKTVHRSSTEEEMSEMDSETNFSNFIGEMFPVDSAASHGLRNFVTMFTVCEDELSFHSGWLWFDLSDDIVITKILDDILWDIHEREDNTIESLCKAIRSKMVILTTEQEGDMWSHILRLAVSLMSQYGISSEQEQEVIHQFKSLYDRRFSAFSMMRERVIVGQIKQKWSGSGLVEISQLSKSMRRMMIGASALEGIELSLRSKKTQLSARTLMIEELNQGGPDWIKRIYHINQPASLYQVEETEIWVNLDDSASVRATFQVIGGCLSILTKIIEAEKTTQHVMLYIELCNDSDYEWED
jgi:hypothetical protein